MKTRQEVLEYGLSFSGTYQDAPFHDENWQLVRVKKNKKAFFIIYRRMYFIFLHLYKLLFYRVCDNILKDTAILIWYKNTWSVRL